MKLREALDAIHQLDRRALICSRRPWLADSETLVVLPDESLRVPVSVKEAGYEYFLDVPTALEVLNVFGDRRPTADERFRLLVHYAENDAYPDWADEEE